MPLIPKNTDDKLQPYNEEEENFTPEQEEAQDEDLFERYHFIVDGGQSPLRIDKYLTSKVQNASRNKVQIAARAGNILVNGEAIKPNYKVKPLDEISVLMEGEPRDTFLVPQDIPLDIAFEDEHLLIVNKTAGMVVHPGHNHRDKTMVNALAWYLKDKKEAADGPLLVHRIDKDTSGILVVAKNELAQSRIARQFFEHSSDRFYYALVWGDVKENQGTIEGHIGRSLKDRTSMTVFPDGAYGKPATTHYEVIERFNYVTFIKCRLETGRTHQIRAHMKFAGHPLFNDAKYGGDQVLRGTTFTKYKQFVQNCFTLLPRQALHAAYLAFDHPITGKRITFESPLPEDIKAVLEKWQRYVKYRDDVFEE